MDNKVKKMINNIESQQALISHAIKSGKYELAWDYSKRLMDELSAGPLHKELEGCFVSSCIEFTNLCSTVGSVDMAFLVEQLKKALKTAKKIGDLRSRALIELHLGRLYFVLGRKHESIKLCENGIKLVDDLGDEDINIQAADIIGFYYVTIGKFNLAHPYFKLSSQNFESRKGYQVIGNRAPYFLGYCEYNMGQFHQAIGTIDYYRKIAEKRSKKGPKIVLQLLLGSFLLSLNKFKEGERHILEAYHGSKKSNDFIAKVVAGMIMTHYHLANNRIEESLNQFIKHIQLTKQLNMFGISESALFIEIAFELYIRVRETMKDVPFQFESDFFKPLLESPNIQTKGVVLRLLSASKMGKGYDAGKIEEELKKSEEYLKESGDLVQLAKTWVVMGRLKLQQGEDADAQFLLREAWKGFAGFGDVFFPDDLRYLLNLSKDGFSSKMTNEDILDQFIDLMDYITPSADLEGFFTQIISATNRFFGAERGGLFLFDKSGERNKPVLSAECNLLQSDLIGVSFKKSESLITQAFKEKRSIIERFENDNGMQYSIKAVMCIPFSTQENMAGVLYHDNSYVKDCFDQFSGRLDRLAKKLAKYIGRIISFTQNVEKKSQDRIRQIEEANKSNILAESMTMINVLKQSDQIAQFDTTVLIMGETGVGKELLAHRIHKMSERHNKQFIIVDSTTLSENLVESELFGHEKGAFTGATQQKQGLIEMANGGTLFIDEVGELPLNIQTKFLRALQEKTIVRVGGSRMIHSDFRLIAATNRDLLQEVKAGNFREDLYYRLNVVPLIIPPLRERREDVLLIADYYIKYYAQKYNKNKAFSLSKEIEQSLLSYSWPGNVRELKNVIERSSLLYLDGQLEINLPEPQSNQYSPIIMNDLPTIDELQRRYINHVLNITNGRISGAGGAAEILGMKRTSLYGRMKKLGIH